MKIKFASKTNSNGWRYQLEIDIENKQFKYGSHLFHSADVSSMTKKQLDELSAALIVQGFERIK